MERNDLLTRRTLVERLKDCEDQESWREFFESYWRLIYGTARKTGLTESEAEEVVQETVITVARKMKEFEYDRARCTFKGWLLRITQFKIIDQLRKRTPAFVQHAASDSTGTRTATIERVPDPKGEELAGLWDEEWTKSLFQAAMDRVKRKVNPGHFQMFYLNVVEKMGIREVARTMRVNAAVVYMAKSRVARAIQNELKRLEEVKAR
jgi:RNA polymerase sigma-70 factor (ECF subfamily)